MFEKLPEETKNSWYNVFLNTMKEYVGYAEEKLIQLEEINMEYKLPGIVDDVREIINPHESWLKKIKNLS